MGWTMACAMVVLYGSRFVGAEVSVAFSRKDIARQKERRGIVEKPTIATISWDGNYFESAKCTTKEIKAGGCVCEHHQDLSKSTAKKFECASAEHVVCEVEFASFGGMRGACLEKAAAGTAVDSSVSALQQGQCNDRGRFREYVERMCINQRSCIISPCAFLTSLGRQEGMSDDDMMNVELVDKIPAQFRNVISSMPCMYNNSIEDLGWGLIVPKCVHRDKCLKQYSIFDQIRLNIFSDGAVGMGGGNEAGRRSTPARQFRLSEEQLVAHRTDHAGPCQEARPGEEDTRVCSFPPTLALPEIPDIYVTQGHEAPEFEVEVSGVEPLYLMAVSALAADPQADGGNENANVVAQVDNAPCGDFLRPFQIVQLVHGQPSETDRFSHYPSAGERKFILRLSDGNKQVVERPFSVFIAPQPRAIHMADYVLTAHQEGNISITASGVPPLALRAVPYGGRVDLFPPVALQLSDDQTSMLMKVSPSNRTGWKEYQIEVTDGNGATFHSTMNVHVLPEPLIAMETVSPDESVGLEGVDQIVTVNHRKKVKFHVVGYAPVQCSIECGGEAVSIEYEEASNEDPNGVTHRHGTATFPAFQHVQGEPVACRGIAQDGNGAVREQAFHIRVVPLPRLDLASFREGEGEAGTLFATVGYTKTKLIPRYYGFAPLKMHVTGGDSAIVPAKGGTYLTQDPEHPTGIVINVKPVGTGVTTIDMYLTDANGAQGTKQSLKLVAVTPPTISFANQDNIKNIVVERGENTHGNPLPVVVTGYDSVDITVQTERGTIVPQNSIKLAMVENSIQTTTSNHLVHTSRMLSFAVTGGESPGGCNLYITVTDANGGQTTRPVYVVAQGKKKKSKYEIWKEKQRNRV